MKDLKTNWSNEDLRTYIMIYCANANFSESKKQVEFIKSHVKNVNFDDIHAQYEKDNDFQSIQKIQASVEEQGYTKDDLNSLMAEVKELFMSDYKFDTLEQNLYRNLNHLFKL